MIYSRKRKCYHLRCGDLVNGAEEGSRNWDVDALYILLPPNKSLVRQKLWRAPAVSHEDCFDHPRYGESPVDLVVLLEKALSTSSRRLPQIFDSGCSTRHEKLGSARVRYPANPARLSMAIFTVKRNIRGERVCPQAREQYPTRHYVASLGTAPSHSNQ